MSFDRDLTRFQTLVDIVARLRALDGCPWDKEQTHRSLRGNFLEECYEVLDALDEEDSTKLRAELGDLLLHIVFQAQIARESGEFTLADVLEGINTKLVRRHPHIFGDQKVKDAAEVAHNWEELKRGERGGDVSPLASVPRQLPSLLYSQEVQHRAVQSGFDWDNKQGIIDKLAEELEEFRSASTPQEKEQEFGDLLFVLVGVAYRQDIDAEASLREANRRFYARFTALEELCRQRGLNLGELSFEKKLDLWDEVKKIVG